MVSTVVVATPFRGMNLRLARAEGEYSDPSYNEDYAHRWREFLAVLGLDTDLGVADFHRVFFALRDGNDEGKYSQDEQQDSDDGEAFHGSSLRSRIKDSRSGWWQLYRIIPTL
jgi:hypothetical protein